jgi:hypothetical protein
MFRVAARQILRQRSDENTHRNLDRLEFGADKPVARRRKMGRVSKRPIPFQAF